MGLSLAYAATVSAMLQYAVRLSAEVESLVRDYSRFGDIICVMYVDGVSGESHGLWSVRK